MPLVKQGKALQAAGDLTGALALYQQAMDGFRAAGVKRPKLKEIMVRTPFPQPAHRCRSVFGSSWRPRSLSSEFVAHFLAVECGGRTLQKP